MTYLIWTLFALTVPGIFALFIWSFLKRRRDLQALKDTPVYQVAGKWSKPEVRAFIRSVLKNPEAKFDEIPCEGDPTHCYGIVTCPGHHRVINRYDRYAPNEGRKRMVQRFCDPKFVEETRNTDSMAVDTRLRER